MMKKLFFTFSLGIICLCANAQLTVFDNGKVHIGNYISKDINTPATLEISSVKAGQSSPRDATGSISFGPGTGATIQGCSQAATLNLFAGKTITFGAAEFSKALVIDGNVFKTSSHFSISAPSFLTTSDARLKKNIEEINDSFYKLLDVNPVSYKLIAPSISDSLSVMTKSSKISEESCFKDDRTHFGFIAQEIQKIYPNLVVEDEEGLLAIDYTGFIPLLVEAYKDMANKVKEQEDMILTLVNQRGPAFMPASVNGVIEQTAQLKHNKPNPFNTSTVIECTLPESISSAFICVYDLQGTQVLRFDIRERGTVNSIIDASSLHPGMYIYSLIADGAEVDSKRMIITD